MTSIALRVAAAEAPKPYPAPGTKAMVELLQRWEREVGGRNPFAETGKLRRLQEQIARETNPGSRVAALAELGRQYLNLGRVDESLAALTNLLATADSQGVALRPAERAAVQLLEGTAWLRQGERANCLHHHNPDSCLAPIRPGGQHVDRTGSERARALFLDLARRDTDDLAARWLLNIAAMTLGDYPERVPTALRIPPSVFESDYPLKRFPEIAAQLGLNLDDVSGGTVVEDFDGDGLLDVAFSSWLVGHQMHLYRNLGNGRFEDRTVEAGLTGITGGLNLIQTDYNNDGWPDLYVVRGAWLGSLGELPDSLLRNNGDGTFADVTAEAGLLSLHPKLSAVWFDADRDGWLDLFVGCETRPTEPKSHPAQLFLNQRNGKFRAAGAEAGVALIGFIRGVTAGDFDNDGWPDLYLSMLDQPNRLLRNDGPKTADGRLSVHFTDVTAKAGVAEPLSSFPCWFWDFDNDGWLDLFVSGYSQDYGSPAAMRDYVADKLGLPASLDRPRLYRNQRDGSFRDVTRAAGLYHVYLAMGANFGDLDNDGWLDFYLGTGTPSFAGLMPNEMFRNDGAGHFQRVGTAGGFGHLQKGHAIAFGDLNNDGQQEVIANMGGAYPGDNYFKAVFANPGQTNHWVSLKLTGREANRAAIGARIRVVIREPAGTREIHRVVGSGGSFGASPLRQEIGLGSATVIERIEVTWPFDGKVSRFTGVALDAFHELEEGDPVPRPLHPKSFAWPPASEGAHSRHK
jgi:hypothetical protein